MRGPSADEVGRAHGRRLGTDPYRDLQGEGAWRTPLKGGRRPETRARVFIRLREAHASVAGSSGRLRAWIYTSAAWALHHSPTPTLPLPSRRSQSRGASIVPSHRGAVHQSRGAVFDRRSRRFGGGWGWIQRSERVMPWCGTVAVLVRVLPSPKTRTPRCLLPFSGRRRAPRRRAHTHIHAPVPVGSPPLPTRWCLFSVRRTMPATTWTREGTSRIIQRTTRRRAFQWP